MGERERNERRVNELVSYVNMELLCQLVHYWEHVMCIV